MALNDDVSLPSDSSSFAEHLDTLDQLLCSENKSDTKEGSFEHHQVSTDDEGSFIQVTTSEGDETPSEDGLPHGSREEESAAAVPPAFPHSSERAADNSQAAPFVASEHEPYRSLPGVGETKGQVCQLNPDTTGDNLRTQGESELEPESSLVECVPESEMTSKNSEIERRAVGAMGYFAYLGSSVDDCVAECASVAAKISANAVVAWQRSASQAALRSRLADPVFWALLLALVSLCLVQRGTGVVPIVDTTQTVSSIPFVQVDSMDLTTLDEIDCSTDIVKLEKRQETPSDLLLAVDHSPGPIPSQNVQQSVPKHKIFPQRPESLLEALNQVKDYQRQIHQSQTFPAPILDDLVRGGLWDQWILHAQRNFFLSLLYIPSQVKNLRTGISQIEKHLAILLQRDIDGLLVPKQHSGDKRSRFFWLKSQASNVMVSFSSYHEFTKLMPFRSSLVDHIASAVEPELQTFEAQMARLFVGLSTAMLDTLSDTSALCEALTLTRTSQFLRMARDFVREPLPIASSRTRQQLYEAITSCTDHESLQQEAKNLIVKHSRTLSTFTFDLPATDNEHERLYYFEKVRQSLGFVASATCLRRSPSLADHLSLLPEFRDQQTKAFAETGKLGSVVSEVLSQFPNHMKDFPVLRHAIGNLETVASVFREQDPSLASLARNHLQDATKAIQLRLEEHGTLSCAEYDDVMRTILQLKRASREINLWVAEIDAAIDHCLDKGAKLAVNRGRFLLTLSRELQSMTGQDSPLAKQLISEHKCFEWAVNAIFNAATARQGVDYVIEKMELDPEAAFRLKVMYEAFDIEYNALLDEGFPAVQAGRSKAFLRDLVRNAKEIAIDSTLAHGDRIWMLSAHLFAYWTLENATTLSTLPNGMNDFSMYLKKPHAPQVTAIWLLLGIIESNGSFDLENHFVELKTGEGKSVVLGVASIILALTQFDVTVICYSSYLSQRDYSDFKVMFESFGVVSSIRYSTADDLAESLASKFGDLRSSARNLLLGQANNPTSGANTSDKPAILLVDEVDVFFKSEILGQGYRPAVSFQSPEVEELVSYVWDHRNQLTREQLLMSEAVNKCLGAVDSRFHRLVKHEALSMLHDAQNSESWEPYVLVEDRIGYKHFDGLSFSMSYGYQTMFAYLREYESGTLSYEAVTGNLGLEVKCGELSFAELPSSFDVILGVSGTIRGLSSEERRILAHVYGVGKLSYVPSAYGENQLAFREADPRDVVLSSSKADFFLELSNEIYNRRKPQENKHSIQRAVLVFFKNSKELLEFYESKPMKDLRSETRAITEAISPSEKRAAFTKATEQGAITLLIREYGRGTDFKCFDSKMLEAGGTHVIQTFYSEESAEEIQLKGRTARQGAKGSYSLVLNFEQLAADFGVTGDEFRRMRNTGDAISVLDQKRDMLARDKNLAMTNAVEKLKGVHYRTLAFLTTDHSGDWLSDAVSFLLELNGLGGEGNSFESNTLEEGLKSKRKNAKQNEPMACDLVALSGRRYGDLTGEGSGMVWDNYYELLGLPTDAKAFSIACSSRLLEACLRLGSVSGKAEEVLGVLSEARTVLLDDEKRAAYDFIIGSPGGSYFKAEGGPIHAS